MKNIKKILTIMLFILIISSSLTVFASEDFILKKEMSFTNPNNYELSKGYVEIMIGQKNFTDYQEDGNIIVTPAPDEIREDEFGNLYAYYDVAGYKPGRTLNVTIERKVNPSTFIEEISVRSEATVTDENKLYVSPQKRVDSDDADLIAKTKEITDGLSSDYKKAQAIFEFINTNMEYTATSTYANQGSLSALKTQKGVCEEFATLFAAMCRAIQIPCKVIEGYRFERVTIKDSEIILDDKTGEHVFSEPEYEYELMNHVWNEMYLDDYGWLPVDTCVLYAPQGKPVAYLDSFCNMENEEYIATGIYNYDRPNRIMENMVEKSYKETLYPVSEAVNENHSFSDIGSYTWAEDAINSLYKMDVIKGYTETEFGPAGNISRIEFITLLSRVLRNLNYQPSSGKKVYYFMDYDQNHYSIEEYDFLMRCLEDEKPFDKFAVGYFAMSEIFGNFLEMNKPITRGEVVALINPFLKLETDGENIFNDILGNRFMDSILKAYTNGLINGYEDGSFRPNGLIRRAEIAVMLDRYIGVRDYVI